MTDPLPAPRGGVAPLQPLPADFRAFHQLYRPAYVRWAELFLGTRADAEEAVDRAFEQLAAEWPDVLRLDGPAGHAWTVLKHHTVEAAHARGRRAVMADTAVFETRALRDAVDPIGELAESLSIYQAIRELPERQHDVIVLRYCVGYSTIETADILGISVPGVRSTARYARHRLKEVLGLDDDERLGGGAGDRRYATDDEERDVTDGERPGGTGGERPDDAAREVSGDDVQVH
ncbi:RNA polymerase sigma factor [Streptomyces sp. NBC_01803]|uniref:RNA polymerase sigma factor n=1 Tax=Streptomyces sp. NBC_01803 TaxID=2975946 RepID=UPI002DD9AAF0|nr:sigma-70 family RNA polymerase sigma factor [Streptomyces sp. NBC_01803]